MPCFQVDTMQLLISNLLFSQCQRQQLLSDYDEQIQEELASLKEAYEKREQTERQIRQKLEKELEYCRAHHKQGTLGKKTDSKKDLNSDIKRVLDEKEAKILQLEKEVIQVSKAEEKTKLSFDTGNYYSYLFVFKSLPPVKFFMLFCRLLIFFKINFLKSSFMTTI